MTSMSMNTMDKRNTNMQLKLTDIANFKGSSVSSLITLIVPYQHCI